MRCRSLLAGALALIACTAGAAEVCPAPNPAYFHQYFSGKIDGRLAFNMELTCKRGVVNGNYRYASKGRQIDLQGQAGPDQAVALDEVGPNGRRSTGSFAGKLEGKRFNGTWTSGDGARRLPFTALQTAEVHIGTRREIMQAAVGEYALENISGFGGANAMWDTWKTKQDWESTASSISLARRETSAIELTRADRRLLDSLRIRVGHDLTTTLSASGRGILTIPFRESGMQLDIQSPDNTQFAASLAQQAAPAGIVDEDLYLLAQDGVDYQPVLKGEFLGVVGDVTVVRYGLATRTFYVEFKMGDCCNQSTFAFKRRNP